MNKFYIFLCLLICAALSSGCKQKEEAPKQQDTLSVSLKPEDTLAVMAAYEGVLPCADCPGIRTRLTLFADSSTYKLEETYMGQRDADSAFITYGQWSVLIGTEEFSEAEVYNLQPYNPEESRYFRVINEDSLVQLDRTKHEIKSKLNYKLTRIVNAEAAKK